jgi:uroporphyrinogen-III synthase
MTTILVIRRDGKFSSVLREAAFNVIDLELIETRAFTDLTELRKKLTSLRDYDGLFFTSPVAAEIFVKERNGSNGFHGCVYALGQRARDVLAAAGLSVKTGVYTNTAEQMLKKFGKREFAGKRFLFVRGEKSLRTIPDSLNGIASVDEVTVYKTEKAELNEAKLKDVKSRLAEGEIKFVCFFSPSGVEGFIELFGGLTSKVRAATIGTTTADAASQVGLNVEFISPSSNTDDFAHSLIKHIKNIE